MAGRPPVASQLGGRDPEFPGHVDSAPPKLTVAEAASLAARCFGLEGSLRRLGGERDQNFLVEAGPRGRFVLKVSCSQDGPEVLEMQGAALRHIGRLDPQLPVMRPQLTVGGAEWADWVAATGEHHLARLFTASPGRHLKVDDFDRDSLRELGIACGRLDLALRGFFHPAAGRTLSWDLRRVPELRPLLTTIEDPGRRAMVQRALDEFEDGPSTQLGRLRAQVIHNDLSLSNLLFDEDRRLSGFLDFGDMIHAPLIIDSVVAAEALLQRRDGMAALASLVAGYSTLIPLEEDEIALLPDLLRARWVALVLISQFRMRRFPATARYVAGWQAGVWEMLETVETLGTELWRHRVRLAASGAPPDVDSQANISALADRRQRVFGPALSPLFYANPLHLVRGSGVWLFDSAGRRYLDAYNNVPIVGHCHPLVLGAQARQAALLNTNVRYLSLPALDLAERLLEMFPADLDTVMFATSGSEANDLAWRLANSFTGAQGTVVSTNAYHGSTTVTAACSPEEWRGRPAPDHVALVPAPDGYFGPSRAGEPGWSLWYSSKVDQAIAELASRGHRPSALLVDTGWSSEGILTPPPQYLQDLQRRWRSRGGLLIADEVQMGFGRSGVRMWGFELAGVVPDIVTLGKPMGNGAAIAAVVTRREIVERFADHARWFSTFGGNPVACAAAHAVLDILERDHLVSHAGEVSQRIDAGLWDLSRRHRCLGDIRRAGLLIGVELVSDPATRAPLDAGRIVDGMRDKGILIGSTGPRHNVLKIRPPLVFQEEHADMLLDALDQVLAGRD